MFIYNIKKTTYVVLYNNIFEMNEELQNFFFTYFNLFFN